MLSFRLIFWLEPTRVMCGTMDGQWKKQILNEQFNLIAVDWIYHILYVRHEKYTKHYVYNLSHFKQSTIISQDDLLSMQYLHKYYRSESFDIKSYAVPNKVIFTNIITADKNMLIGLNYIHTEYTSNNFNLYRAIRRKVFEDDKAYYFFTQNVYPLSEKLTLVKFIDERKEECPLMCTYSLLCNH